MKTIFKLTVMVMAFVIMTTKAISQTLESYITSKGVYNLREAVHPSNDFLNGTYDIGSNYVDISIRSADNITGLPVHTSIRLVKGKSNLVFSDIIVLSDDDPWAEPFDAFGLSAHLLVGLSKAVGSTVYEQIRTAVRDATGTDFEYWTGKTWALLALNLDYYEYMLTGK